MPRPSDHHAQAYDPFGEPLGLSRSPTGEKSPAIGSYRETRRAALVFWALAILFVGSRIFLSDQPAAHDVTGSVPSSGQVATQR